MDTKAKAEIADVLAEIIKPKARLSDTKEFLGVDPLHQREVSLTFHLFKSALMAKSLALHLKDLDIVETHSYDWNDNECPPTYRKMKVAVDQEEMLPCKAHFFINGKVRHILAIDVLDHPFEGVLKVISASKDIEEATASLEVITELSRTNNIYKGNILTPLGEFLPPPAVSMDDLFISDKTRDDIDANIIGFLKKKDVYDTNDLPFTRGVILEGRPGTGKTLLGKVLSNMNGVSFIWATPKFMCDTGMINNTFAMARELAPSILFLEDMDTYASVRDKILGEILAEMDGMKPNDGVIVIATTNYAERLDTALLSRPSRFDVRIKLGVQPEDVRRKYIDHLLQNATLNDSVDIDALVKITENYNPVYIQELIRLAKIIAINTGSLGADRAILKMEHFVAASESINKNQVSCEVPDVPVATGAPLSK